MELTSPGPPDIPGVQISGRLGQGGYSVVWRGIEERTERWVAVKIFAAPITSKVARELFLQELANVGKLDQVPSAIRVHSHGVTADRRPYLVMELCDRSVHQLVQQRTSLDARRTAEIALDVASALIGFHSAGGVHRDVKPENILLRTTNEAVLSDFGLSLRDDGSGHTLVGGTPEYAAPEQLLRDEATPRSDLYGLGASMYFMLTGRSPHPPRAGRSEREYAELVAGHVPPPLPPTVPSPLSRLVAELLARAPSCRPADANAVALRLAELLDDPARPATIDAGRDPGVAPTGVRVVDPKEDRPAVRAQPRSRRLRKPLVVVAAATGMLVVGLAALGAAMRPGNAGPAPSPGASTDPAAPAATQAQARIALAPPVDNGTTVQLSWTGPAGFDFAVAVAEEGRSAEVKLAGKGETLSVPVTVGKRYCFQVLGTDGARTASSDFVGIRGARCTS